MPNRRGFSLIEVVIALMVAGLLLSISVSAFGTVRARYSVREARNSFAALQARARAQAIEYAQTVEFHADADGDSIWISRNDTILERMRLNDEFGVDMRSSSTPFTLCFNARGYGGDASCSTFSSPVSVGFFSATDSARVGVLPYGQLVY